MGLASLCFRTQKLRFQYLCEDLKASIHVCLNFPTKVQIFLKMLIRVFLIFGTFEFLSHGLEFLQPLMNHLFLIMKTCSHPYLNWSQCFPKSPFWWCYELIHYQQNFYVTLFLSYNPDKDFLRLIKEVFSQKEIQRKVRMFEVDQVWKIKNLRPPLYLLQY